MEGQKSQLNMMNLNEIYIKLYHDVYTNPNMYEFTDIISRKIMEISKNDNAKIYLNAIYLLIIRHHVSEMMTNNPHMNINQVKENLIINGKKGIYNLSYDGHTYEGGKGIKFIDIESGKIPQILLRIIVAYIQMISL